MARVKYAHDSLYIFGSCYLCDAANYESIIMGALANARFAAEETAEFALEDTAVKYLATTMNE